MWKNEDKKRKYDWEEVMANTMNFFDTMKDKGYEDRVGQQDMSLDIVDAIKDQQNVIVEASVGIGKSYAYLIPLMYYYKLTGKTFIISTSTIALQEQLGNDVKKLSELMHFPINVTIAKGKTNYLCKNKLFSVKTENIKKEFENLKINDERNDRSNVQNLSESEWEKVNVTECKFNKCFEYANCEFAKKRRKMREARGVIICNHDLLLENQKRRYDGGRELLVESDVIVLDESHNLEEKARNSYKEVLILNEIINAINNSVKLLTKVGFVINEKSVANLKENLNGFFFIIKKQVRKEISKLKKNNTILNDNDLEMCEFKFSKDLINKFRLIHKEIYNISTKTSIYEDDREGKSMGDILYNTTDFFRELCKGKNKSDYIFWIEKCKNSYILVRSPKNIEKNLKKILFDDKKSIKVLTSATLNTVADGEKYYDYYMNSIGLTRNEEIWICKPIRSTFDLKNNTLMYYANDLAHPQNEHEKYINDITNRIIELINITKGKTLILFTSKADMKIVYDNIKNKNLKYNLIIQNDGASQKKIIEKFKDDIDSVLFSTGTFWEGIDIQGKSLSSVIIVRLPFPVLNPIINYKTEMLNNKLDVLVPEMLIKLKQGIGRLIRGKYDKGIVSILDQRISDLSKSSYKQLVFECVEANIVTNKLSVVEKFVREKNIV